MQIRYKSHRDEGLSNLEIEDETVYESKIWRFPVKWVFLIALLIPLLSVVLFFIRQSYLEQPAKAAEKFYTAIYTGDIDQFISLNDPEDQFFRELTREQQEELIGIMDEFYREEYREDWNDHLSMGILDKDKNSARVVVKLKKSDDVIEGLWGDMPDVVNLTELLLKKEKANGVCYSARRDLQSLYQEYGMQLLNKVGNYIFVCLKFGCTV